MNRSRTTKSEPAPPEHNPGRDSIEPSRRDAVSDWLDLFVRLLGLPASEATQVRDELEDHLRSRVDDLLITGVSEPEAVRQAVAELGETASLAQGFKQARRNPRRRLAMHAALFIVAGSALVLSSAVVFQQGTKLPTAASGSETLAMGDQPETGLEVASFESRFGQDLQRFEVGDLVHADGPLQVTSAGQQLLVTIMGLVDHPAGWVNVMDVSRTGERAFFPEDSQKATRGRIGIVGNTLFVKADQEQVEGVEWVLASLRDTASKMIAELKAERALRDARQKELNAKLARENEKQQALAMERGRQIRETAAKQQAERLAQLRQEYSDIKNRLIELRLEAYDHQKELNKRRRMAPSPFSTLIVRPDDGRTEEETEEQRGQNAAFYRDSVREVGLREFEMEDLEQRLVRVRALLIDLDLGVPSATARDAAERESAEPETSTEGGG